MIQKIVAHLYFSRFSASPMPYNDNSEKSTIVSRVDLNLKKCLESQSFSLATPSNASDFSMAENNSISSHLPSIVTSEYHPMMSSSPLVLNNKRDDSIMNSVDPDDIIDSAVIL